MRTQPHYFRAGGRAGRGTYMFDPCRFRDRSQKASTSPYIICWKGNNWRRRNVSNSRPERIPFLTNACFKGPIIYRNRRLPFARTYKLGPQQNVSPESRLQAASLVISPWGLKQDEAACLANSRQSASDPCPTLFLSRFGCVIVASQIAWTNMDR